MRSLQNNSRPSDIEYYQRGFKNGYASGAFDERGRKDRIAWRKLFLVVLLASFTAHFLWAVIAAYVV